MVMFADAVDVVIGIDTHKHTHTATVVNTSNGAVLATVTVPTTPAGYRQLLELGRAHGRTRTWAIEGTRTYGTGLLRALQGGGERVIEADRPKRPPRRNGAKTDEIDALRCAREAIANPALGQPRSGDQRDALAMLLACRDSAVEASKNAQNQLQAFIVTAPDELRSRLRDCPTPTRRWAMCARLRHRQGEDTATATAINVLVATAKRIVALEAEARQHAREILAIVRQWRPDLLEHVGVGPIVAAIVLCAWSHQGRFRSDAAFAMVAGTAPIPASSGQTVRHRLNRRGDRQLNKAIHTIVLSRLRYDDNTKAYAGRRTTEGKTPAEIRRCLKRYVTRQIFRALENPPKPLDTP